MDIDIEDEEDDGCVSVECDDSDARIAEQSYRRLEAEYTKRGFKEGAYLGNQQSLELGISDGFLKGVESSLLIGKLKGELSALRCYAELCGCSDEVRDSAKTLLCRLEELEATYFRESWQEQFADAQRKHTPLEGHVSEDDSVCKDTLEGHISEDDSEEQQGDRTRVVVQQSTGDQQLKHRTVEELMAGCTSVLVLPSVFLPFQEAKEQLRDTLLARRGAVGNKKED